LPVEGDGEAGVPDAVDVARYARLVGDGRRKDFDVLVADLLELGEGLGEGVGDGLGGLAEGVDLGRVAAEDVSTNHELIDSQTP
jgi:hypothetical protein